MSILSQLSSQVGDRTEKSNRKVAAECLARPELLPEIAGGLTRNEAAMVGDCAEVLTEVAKQRPDWIAPYAESLSTLLTHPATRVRWEAMHALALTASTVPEVIEVLLPRLTDIIQTDSSVIVRDHAVDAVGSYARTSSQAAQAAYPILVKALTSWDGKQAAHALEGLANVGMSAAGLEEELWAIGIRYHDDPRARVHKAARALVKGAKRA